MLVAQNSLGPVGPVPLTVRVTVGPSRGGKSGGHKRQLGWDASQDSRRMLLAESVTDEAASNIASKNARRETRDQWFLSVSPRTQLRR